MRGYTQANRILRLKVKGLGEDDLLLKSLHGQESISRLYHFDLQLFSENPAIDFPGVIGQEANIEIALPDDTIRHIGGIISGFSQGGSTQVTVDGDPAVFAFYEATLVPWIWRLTLRANCRIFQNLSVPDIVAKILDEHDVGRHRMRLTRSYETREYCVQYRETDFNFMSRLLEEEGIFYFFEHTAEGHMMVLADHPVVFKPCPNHATASFAPQTGRDASDGVVTEFQMTRQERPAEFTHRDFKFQQPLLDLTTRSGQHPAMSEIYDYPGEYRSLGRGQQLADVRMDQEAMPGVVISGASRCCGFTPGFRFQFDRHYRPDFNIEYVLTAVAHTMDLGSNYLRNDASEFVYVNSFQCIPFGDPYSPLRLTPSPVIHGTQTAMVVGPPGEEIFVDEHGRVKVQFHWDREGKHDENSSCFMRVSQYWAGDKWGAIHTPRIGQEVIVDFLEGDPDQPIIVGRVYNGNSRPPYELPKFQTISTVKSNSTKGGKGFNELRFEDKKGKEQVFIHSQKRMDVRVRQSLYETNHANRHMVVGWDDGENSGGDFNVTVSGDHNFHIKKGCYEGIDEKLNLTVKNDVVYDHQTKLSTMVKTKTELNAQEVTVEAFLRITLKVGENFIVIDPSGITIKGAMVKINSGGAATGTGDPEIEDPLDADVADTGEPGWLDRPRTGGAPAGRRRRTLRSQHGPSAKAFRLTAARGRGDDLDRALVAKELDRMPTHFLDRLEKKRTTIVVCRDSVTDAHPELRGVQPRGWPPGSTWDSVPGAEMPDSNEVVIATRGHGTPEGAHVPRTGDGHGSSNLVVHETVHAIDGTGTPPLSQSPNFTAARTGDAATLDPYESQPPPAGQEESFAESAARYYSGDPGDAAAHPNLHRYWDGDPFNPARPRP